MKKEYTSGNYVLVVEEDKDWKGVNVYTQGEHSKFLPEIHVKGRMFMLFEQEDDYSKLDFKVNWGAFGSQDIDNAKVFMEEMESALKAIEYFKEVLYKLQNG